MRFEVGEKVIVTDYTTELLQWCNENLVIDNPEYLKKLRMGKWLGNTPQKIYLYERDGRSLLLPFGCVSVLMRKYKGERFCSLIKSPRPFKYNSSINLYRYQNDAVEKALFAKNGVIVMPCGAGKTQTALEIISRIGVKTLWLTHTQDLLNQSMNRAKSVLDCPVSSYGTITGGRVNIGDGITFATVQTMSKIDLTVYKDAWGMIVVDECHKAIGSPTKVMQFYKVLSNISCRYKFGLTATPRRADGLQTSMFALIGGIIHEVSREDVACTTCKVMVGHIYTGYVPDMNMALCGDGTINYAGLVDDMTHNKQRMEFVSNVINGLKGGTLVLANRVEYLKELQKMCRKKSICLSALGASKAAKAERKEALRKLNDGELDCVFATYQLAKEGLDVPNLRYVIFATPEKDETTVMQAAGRVGRKCEGKELGVVIDFVDDFGMYRGWAKKRDAFYKKLKYDIDTW